MNQPILEHVDTKSHLQKAKDRTSVYLTKRSFNNMEKWMQGRKELCIFASLKYIPFMLDNDWAGYRTLGSLYIPMLIASLLSIRSSYMCSL